MRVGESGKECRERQGIGVRNVGALLGEGGGLSGKMEKSMLVRAS